jgi:hypothetical protein
MHIGKPLLLHERGDFMLTVFAHRKLGFIRLWSVASHSNVCLGAFVSLDAIRSSGFIRELGRILEVEGVLFLRWACPKLGGVYALVWVHLQEVVVTDLHVDL